MERKVISVTDLRHLGFEISSILEFDICSLLPAGRLVNLCCRSGGGGGFEGDIWLFWEPQFNMKTFGPSCCKKIKKLAKKLASALRVDGARHITGVFGWTQPISLTPSTGPERPHS